MASLPSSSAARSARFRHSASLLDAGEILRGPLASCSRSRIAERRHCDDAAFIAARPWLPAPADASIAPRRCVETRIVAPVLDHAAGMRRGGAIASEQARGLRQRQPERNAREIHPGLTRQRDFRAAARVRRSGRRRKYRRHRRRFPAIALRTRDCARPRRARPAPACAPPGVNNGLFHRTLYRT